MAKNKFYAVKNGVETGIYDTWEDCKKQVIGYKGAIYKSFFTYEDAKNFLENNEDGAISKETAQNKAIAYVDGSYNIVTSEYSYGVVIFYNGQEYQFNQKFDDEKLREMRNVAGEIEGAKKAMSFCLENNIEKLDIYYDYQGIESWATGVWKTNKDGTSNYKKYYDDIKDKVKVTFNKVKAHSNNKYNDIADKLAKSALGM